MSVNLSDLGLPTFKEAQVFDPDVTPWPEGVYEEIVPGQLRGLSYANVRYLLNTPDGTVEVFAGDWIVTTFQNEKYYVRFQME